MNKLNQCPVCGYTMDREPANFNICSSCGTEFGYSDSGRTFAELRAEWIEDGANWHSRIQKKPLLWNGYMQMLTSGLITLAEFQLLVPGVFSINAITGAATDHLDVVRLPGAREVYVGDGGLRAVA